MEQYKHILCIYCLHRNRFEQNKFGKISVIEHCDFKMYQFNKVTSLEQCKYFHHEHYID